MKDRDQKISFNMIPQSKAVLASYLIAVLTSCNGFVHHTNQQSRSALSWEISQCNSRNSKNSLAMDRTNRARIEKKLEDLMGDDWRKFRANLVKQEQTDQALLFAQQKQQQKNKKHSNSMIFSSNVEGQHNQQEEQEKLGNMFTTAISSIFNQKTQQEGTIQKDPQEKNVVKDFGELCGIGGSSEPCPDPFEESYEPFFIPPDAEQVKFDKNRWAHPLSHVEPGCILIANEHLGGVFHHTVVLIVDHHDKTGSTGIVINRPQGKLFDIANEQPGNLDTSLKHTFKNATVSYGGPVIPEEFSALHGFGKVHGSKRVGSGVFLGGSQELQEEVRIGQFSPNNVLFVRGHAAWVPQQLSREIAKGVWYIASACDDFVLRHAGAEQTQQDTGDLWYDVLTSMGGDYAEIAKNWKDANSGVDL